MSMFPAEKTLLLILFILNTIVLYLTFSEMLKRQKRMEKTINTRGKINEAAMFPNFFYIGHPR